LPLLALHKCYAFTFTCAFKHVSSFEYAESSGAGTNLKAGTHRPARSARKKNFGRAPPLFRTIIRFGERFRDGQYSLVCYFQLMVPQCPVICKGEDGGSRAQLFVKGEDGAPRAQLLVKGEDGGSRALWSRPRWVSL